MSRPGDDSLSDQDRILKEAAADPNATATELADRVSNVTPELVERVLEEHGDKVDTDDASEPIETHPDREDISDRQIRTLQAIAAHPDATQRDIASFLDVTAATVSNRVNSLPGFEWDNRREFVKEVLDLDSIPGTDRSVVVDSTELDLQETIEDLIDRVERLEQRVEGDEGTVGGSSPFDDPELVRKIVHVCMDAEEISEEDELRILQHFVDQ